MRVGQPSRALPVLQIFLPAPRGVVDVVLVSVLSRRRDPTWLPAQGLLLLLLHGLSQVLPQGDELLLQALALSPPEFELHAGPFELKASGLGVLGSPLPHPALQLGGLLLGPPQQPLRLPDGALQASDLGLLRGLRVVRLV